MTKCTYCGEPKEEHEKSQIKTKRSHVKAKFGVVSRTVGTAVFIGDCEKKAREDESWEL